MPNFWDNLSHYGILPGFMVSIDKAVMQEKINSAMSMAKHNKTVLHLLSNSIVQSVWVLEASHMRQLLRNPGSFYHGTPPFLTHGLYLPGRQGNALQGVLWCCLEMAYIFIPSTLF